MTPTGMFGVFRQQTTKLRKRKKMWMDNTSTVEIKINPVPRNITLGCFTLPALWLILSLLATLVGTVFELFSGSIKGIKSLLPLLMPGCLLILAYACAEPVWRALHSPSYIRIADGTIEFRFLLHRLRLPAMALRRAYQMPYRGWRRLYRRVVFFRIEYQHHGKSGAVMFDVSMVADLPRLVSALHTANPDMAIDEG